ncbi:pig-M [Schizosaccharomyces japonicus yFS275]|uniref:GPI mannosyltransferase 1 n=1 Tax=Schizosaccharomyces japonicus (strain yFS275 / FY16936) TaxID=402676 RepID=B6K3D1_SCHJY|nr:pig-M [Schizosaccharomyces japonicus yFS275]EEB07988.1 pig-M [Schizosaccharomyces japonicus yFS275]
MVAVYTVFGFFCQWFLSRIHVLGFVSEKSMYTVQSVPIEEIMGLFVQSMLSLFMLFNATCFDSISFRRKRSKPLAIAMFTLCFIGSVIASADPNFTLLGSVLMLQCAVIGFLFTFVTPFFSPSGLLCIVFHMLYSCLTLKHKIRHGLLLLNPGLSLSYYSIYIELAIAFLLQGLILQLILQLTITVHSSFHKRLQQKCLSKLRVITNPQAVFGHAATLEFESSMLLETSLRARLFELVYFMRRVQQSDNLRDSTMHKLRRLDSHSLFEDLCLPADRVRPIIALQSEREKFPVTEYYQKLVRHYVECVCYWSSKSYTDRELEILYKVTDKLAHARTCLSNKELINIESDLPVLSQILSADIREAFIQYVFRCEALFQIGSQSRVKRFFKFIRWMYFPTAVQAVLVLSTLLHIGFIAYGCWVDANFAVKFTDIDYSVFTDASKYIALGQSPYNRETYRYTPLLAIALLPTQYGFPSWGKVVFSVSDIVAGYLITRLLRRRGFSSKQAAILSSVWLLNPMVIAISARGSCEGILGLVTMAMLTYLDEGKLYLAGLVLGFGVHFKIYPFIYGIAMMFYLGHPIRDAVTGKLSLWNFFSRDQFKVLFSSLFCFIGCNILMYVKYGWPFLHHTYLYHLGRIDHRHNFSVYHLMLYLASASHNSLSPLIAFVPQMVLCVLIPLVHAKHNIVGTMFAQTFAFVTFNKVCTSQYFIWYLIFIPMMLPYNISVIKKGVFFILPWVLGQVLWLFYAYKLEFLGENQFNALWFAGAIFFLSCIWTLQNVIKKL